MSSVYMQALVDKVITPAMEVGFNAELKATLTGLVVMMITVYSLVILCSFRLRKMKRGSFRPLRGTWMAESFL